MYESFFGFNQRPFSAAPLVSRYVAVPSMERTRKTLCRCISRAEGAALLVGPAGSGKTLLCHLLAEQFQQEFKPVLLSSGHLTTRKDLLQAILFELGLPYRGLEEGELRLSLIDHLTRSPQCPNGMLLLADEAHTLPLKLLEELRMITNVVRAGQPRVRLVLAGGPALEERLANPKLESFSQRLAARCYLESMDRTETLDYVRTLVRQAGAESDAVFPSDALEAIYRASDGIPRLVNQISDHALVLALQSRRKPVDAATVERAWADLQQLPAPWPEAAIEADDELERAIEFGDLDDDLIATPPASNAEEIDPWGAGGNEVDLVFDDPGTEQDEQFEVNLSSTELARDGQTPDWHSTEFSPLGLATAAEGNFDQWQCCEGEMACEEQLVEEIVVDRYAALDAMKSKGEFATPSRYPAASQPGRANISTAAEKSLTLAEALVQHATALEQNGGHGELPMDPLVSEVAASGVVPDSWTTVDLVAPSGDQTPEPDDNVLDGLTINLQCAENAACDYGEPVASAVTKEPALIVIEDDLPEPVTPTPPTAMPVKRQEYRQLFARLRKH